MLSLKLKLKLVAFATCIFIFFSLLAVLEEKVYFTRYGGVINEEDGKAGEVFKMPVAFVAVQSVVFSLVAKGSNQGSNKIQTTLAINCLSFAQAHCWFRERQKTQRHTSSTCSSQCFGYQAWLHRKWLCSGFLTLLS